MKPKDKGGEAGAGDGELGVGGAQCKNSVSLFSHVEVPGRDRTLATDVTMPDL